jgi:hypothetical protein
LLYFSVNSWLCSISFIIDMCDPTDITPILYESFFNINSSYSSFGSFKDSTILLPISSWWYSRNESVDVSEFSSKKTSANLSRERSSSSFSLMPQL